MSLGILGKKIGMTQIFGSKGERIPVTLVQTSEYYVVQKKAAEKHGYNSIVIGGWPLTISKALRAKKAQQLFFKNLGLPFLSKIKEYKINSSETFNSYKVGDVISLNIFNVGEKVKVSGLCVGKGTQGNIKLNKFNRGPMSHGSKHHRLQGSLGAGTSPGRVFPGKKMPRKAGNSQVTFYGIEIIKILENLIALKGSVPGKLGNIIKIVKN